jgi:hypothetical protein
MERGGGWGSHHLSLPKHDHSSVFLEGVPPTFLHTKIFKNTISLRNTLPGLCKTCGYHPGVRALRSMCRARFLQPLGGKARVPSSAKTEWSPLRVTSRGCFSPHAGNPIEVLDPRGGSLGTGSVPFKESEIDSQKLIKMEFRPFLVPLEDGEGARLTPWQPFSDSVLLKSSEIPGPSAVSCLLSLASHCPTLPPALSFWLALTFPVSFRPRQFQKSRKPRNRAERDPPQRPGDGRARGGAEMGVGAVTGEGLAAWGKPFCVSRDTASTMNPSGSGESAQSTKAYIAEAAVGPAHASWVPLRILGGGEGRGMACRDAAGHVVAGTQIVPDHSFQAFLPCLAWRGQGRYLGTYSGWAPGWDS